LDTTCPTRRTRKLQHLELPRRQHHLLSVPPHPPPPWVDAEVAHLHRRRVFADRAAKQCPHAGHQHRERERLGEVVVGSGFERLRLVQVAILGGQHQDRRPDALRPQVGADLKAVPARQHDVQDDQVVGALPGPPQPVVTVERHRHAKTFGLETADHGGRDLLVILHDQDLHLPHPVLFG
jgi:hypothetical protein